MNGDHTLTAIKDRLTEVRDSLGAAQPSIPASEIIARARRRRVRRRLIPSTAGVLALAAGTALALTTLAPASHHPQVQLAAWTIVKQPGGNVSVTIRELHDPAGLQHRLRADGVPATVTFLGQQNPACHPWPGAALHGMSTPAGNALFNKVFPPDSGSTRRRHRDPPLGPSRRRRCPAGRWLRPRARPGHSNRGRPGAGQPAVHRQLSRPADHPAILMTYPKAAPKPLLWPPSRHPDKDAAK